MNLKKLLTVATLFVTSALGFNLQAQQTPEAGKTYYLYNYTSEVFLSRGNNWAAQAKMDDHGIPFVLEDAGSETYYIKFLDGRYLGDDGFLYTDMDTKESGRTRKYKLILDDAESKIYKIQNTNNSKYVENWYGNAVGDATENRLNYLWQFYSEDDRNNKIKVGGDYNIKNVIEAAGLSVETNNFEALLNSGDYALKDMTGKIGTAKFNGSRGNWVWTRGGDNCNEAVYGADFCEFYENQVGTLSQTITGLKEGIYKVEVQGFERPRFPNESQAIADAGNEFRTAYLQANNEKVFLKSWIEEKGEGHDPNNVGQAVAKFNEGKYVNKLYVYVPESGTMDLKFVVPSGTGGHWVILNNFTLTYYTDQVSEQDAAELIESMPTGKMNKDVEAEMEAAKDVFEADKTIANYNVLSEAINAANASVAAYANAKAYFDSAEPILAGTNVYTEDAYNQYFATPLAEYEAGTLETAEASSFIKHSTGWHSDKTVDEILLSAWTIGGAQAHKFDTNLYINTWSVEGANDGSEFLAPFFEYWGDDKLSLATTDIQAKVTGLEPSTTYSFTIRARVRATNNSEKIANAITMKVGEGEAVDISSGAKFKDTQFYIGNFTAVGETDAEGTLTATITVAEGCNVSWLSFYNANYTEGEDLSAYKADYEFALETANQLLEDAAYVNVTGVERDELSSVVDEYTEVEEDKESYIAAKEALEAAANAFATAKASYDEFVSIKNLAANYEELAYASLEKKNAFDDACNLRDPDDAEMASELAFVISTTLRAYVESNGMAEGVDGAEDKTSLIANASNPTNNEGWTIEGDMNNPLSNEPWEDSHGNSSFSYFDGGNWHANSWTTTMKQTITVPAGKYLLTAVGRASNGVTLTMSVGENSVNLPNTGASGNVFGRGWNDASLEFETPCNAAEEEITITVTATTGTQHQWFSVSNFRLVSLDPAENANMAITGAGWATFIAPFEVEIPAGVTAYTVEGVKVDNYLNKAALENVIPANTPVLLEGEAMTATFYGQSTATQDTYGDALVGNVSGVTKNVPNNGESFVLLMQDGNLGFYKVATDDIKVDNNRCYLNVPTGGEIKAFFFDDEATGINGIADDATVVERYNAAGMKVAAPVKGINIVKLSNGKVQKVLVK